MIVFYLSRSQYIIYHIKNLQFQAAGTAKQFDNFLSYNKIRNLMVDVIYVLNEISCIDVHK